MGNFPGYQDCEERQAAGNLQLAAGAIPHFTLVYPCGGGYNGGRLWKSIPQVDMSDGLNDGDDDKKCYIVAMEPVKYSLYKPALEKPGDSYTCSKCLQCVASCPNGSLIYKV